MLETSNLKLALAEGKDIIDFETHFNPNWEKVDKAISNSGTSAQRPTENLYIGQFYFDTTLSKPIWYKGDSWVDATGVVV